MRAADFSKLNFLYVHGNQSIAPIIRNFLHTMYVRQLYEVTNAMQAISRLSETECDVAIVDLAIGDIDGAELVQLVRTDQTSPNPCLPIIMVSSYSERSIVEAAIRAGVDAYLVTPISHHALQQRINWVINNPRSFIEHENYEGPDRRSCSDANFAGEDQRDCLEV